MKRYDFLKFFEDRINYLKESGREGTALNYRRAKNSLLRFLKGKPLSFFQIDSSFAEEYSDWMKARGMVRNSISFHLRILRALYNKGVKSGYVKQTYPFRDVYTGIDHTRKRSVDCSVIRRLKSLSLPDNSSLSIARDLFLFSIYSRGMAFVDIAFLQKRQVSKSEIVYKRKKTGQVLRIHIEKEMRHLLDKYMPLYPESPYVFPILSYFPDEELYTAYVKSLSVYNYRLGKLAKKLGVDTKITSYTARHTWASAAYRGSVPIGVISASMGHRSEKTTRIYLDSLDDGAIDRANRKVLKRLIG